MLFVTFGETTNTVMVVVSICSPHAIVSRTLALASHSASLCLISVVSESFIAQSKHLASAACVYFSSNLTFLNRDKIEDPTENNE